MSDTLDRAGLELFGQIVSANVAHTQWATDRVLEFEKDKYRSLAEAFILLYRSVDRAADVVTTRALEAALDRAAVAYNDAVRELSGDAW